MKGIVLDIHRGAMNDGPGIRTTVFLKGCVLGCPWCHNPESRSPYPQVGIDRANAEIERSRIQGKYLMDLNERCELKGYADRLPEGLAEEYPIYGRYMEAEEVMGQVMKDRHFYDSSGGGLTLSGGEPLFQPDFALELIKSARTGGIHTCLDTSGYAGKEVLEEFIPFVDLFLYDIKLLDPALHRQYTGVALDRIMDNLEMLVKMNCRIIIRSPIIPGINDFAGHFEGLKKLGSVYDRIQKIELLPYHDYYLSKLDRLPGDSPIRAIIPDNFPEKIRQTEQWLNGNGPILPYRLKTKPPGDHNY